MSDAVLKFRSEGDVGGVKRKASLGERLRARARLTLLVIVPLIGLIAGLALYLSGGRIVSTDNAYVGAQKVLVTPDISGKIAAVSIKEGQHVSAGDVLFVIDATPYRLALAQAQSKLESTRTDFNNMKSNLASLDKLVDLSQQNVALKRRDVERKQQLVTRAGASQSDLDNSMSAAVTAELEAQFAAQQQASTLNALLGKRDLPLDEYPPYRQAKAAVDQAERDLDHTTLKASISGTATQVDNIQLGRFVTAGTPILSIIDDAAPWVDANPKETDLTNVRTGQKVVVSVDAFPARSFRGTISSISPGTGAEFAILPPQNAIGNWVKVVQRVPVRIAFDAGQDVSLLRAGMSVTVDIDTGHSRSLRSLISAFMRTGGPP
ncbi:MAG TPA: HlyD family secretion protein [Xanthobacteraceae bacterium]|nr:HlyD family secretion protein [Xanthobacteraceae bacterium]